MSQVSDPVTNGHGWSFSVTIGCDDPGRQAAFWGAALGYGPVGEASACVAMAPRGGAGPTLVLQQRPSPGPAEMAFPLDIKAADVEAAALRLELLGGQRVSGRAVHDHGSAGILMADPEGNEFWVVGGNGAASTAPSA